MINQARSGSLHLDRSFDPWSSVNFIHLHYTVTPFCGCFTFVHSGLLCIIRMHSLSTFEAEP
jgi:hypothetical protein